MDERLAERKRAEWSVCSVRKWQRKNYPRVMREAKPPSLRGAMQRARFLAAELKWHLKLVRWALRWQLRAAVERLCRRFDAWVDADWSDLDAKAREAIEREE